MEVNQTSPSPSSSRLFLLHRFSATSRVHMVKALTPLFLAACGWQQMPGEEISHIQGNVRVGHCGVPIPDRTSNSLSELAARNALQKVHRIALKPAQSKKWVHPVAGTRMDDWRNFGVISTALEEVNGGHEGVDIGAALNAPVVAASSGTVVYALIGCTNFDPERPHLIDQWCGDGWGNHVVINHGNNVFTRYAHLTEVSAVPGTQVKAGQKIGTVGRTGLTKFEHLHFELGYRESRFKTCYSPQPFLTEGRAEYGSEGVYDPKKLPF